MTLGNVYDLDLRKNENLIKEVIVQAQGEVCLGAYFTGMQAKGISLRWHSRSISSK